MLKDRIISHHRRQSFMPRMYKIHKRKSVKIMVGVSSVWSRLSSSFSFSDQNMSNNWGLHTQHYSVNETTTVVEIKVVLFHLAKHCIFVIWFPPEGIQSSRQYSGQSPASRTDLRTEVSSRSSLLYGHYQDTTFYFNSSKLKQTHHQHLHMFLPQGLVLFWAASS